MVLPDRHIEYQGGATVFMVGDGLEEPIDPETYRLVVGDKLTLIIRREYQEPNIFEIEVLSEGKVILPYLDEMQAEGLALARFTKIVKESYGIVFPEYEVNVLLQNLGEFMINIVGGVRRPGVITVNSATRLSAAIEATGGLLNYGSIRNIQIQKGNETAAYDLFSYLNEGQIDQNPYLRPGSIVIIPPKFGEVSIVGEVREPGTYEIVEGETILDVFSFAKGLTPIADKNNVLLKRMLLTNEGETEFEKIPVSMSAVMAGKEKPPVIHGGDEIIVYSFATDKIGTVEVRGNIQNPGFYDLFQGMTATDLIRSAGGFLKSMGSTRAILLSRNSGGDLSKIEIDLSNYPASGKTNELKPGDRLYIFNPESSMGYVSVEGTMVTSPGFFPYYPGMTAYEAINMAGGIAWQNVGEMKTPENYNPAEEVEGKKKIEEGGVVSLRNSYILRSDAATTGGGDDAYLPLRLDQLFYRQDMSFDVRLEMGDRLIVGMRKHDYVLVTGAVRQPGEIPFMANMPAHYYAGMAGITNEAEMESMVLLRNGTQVIKDPNATVMPGDVITVKTKKETRQKSNISKYSQIISSIYMIHTMIDNAND